VISLDSANRWLFASSLQQAPKVEQPQEEESNRNSGATEEERKMVLDVERQTVSTAPDTTGKAEAKDWPVAKLSVATVDESRDAVDSSGTPAEGDANWFDYFFGPIPAAEQTGDGRDAVEEARQRHSVEPSVAGPPATPAATPAARPAREYESMFNGVLSWLEPSYTGQTPSAKAETTLLGADTAVSKGQTDHVSEIRDAYDAPIKTDGDAAPAPEKKETPEAVNKSLDHVALAVSEDNANDGDTASVASSAVNSQGKMLFGDLVSVPSVKGETINDSASVKTADLDTKSVASNKGRNEASVVEEKVKNLKIPLENASVPKVTTMAGSNLAADTRRVLLLKELKSTVATFGQYDIRAASINSALGDLFDESKKHEQAIKLHRESLAIYSTKLGDDHTTTLDQKLKLGRVLENAGIYEEAITVYYQVTIMRRAIRGEKDPSSADSLSRMAAVLKKKGEYQLAVKELKRALKVYREALGDAHEKVSVTVDEIASLYVTQGDFQKASAILEEVVKLKAATKGMKSKAVATTLITLATTYECSEDFGKSMKSLKKAYKIYTEMGGYSSKDAISTLDRIAQLYEAMEDNDRAAIAYLGVLRGRKIHFGEDHLLVGEAYFKLGHALRQSGQREKALKCMKEALPIFVSKGVEMNDVEMIAEVMHEMALINKEKHRYAEAARIFKQELGVRRKIGQAEFPMIARTLNHLGVTEYEMKNNNKSLKYLIEALTIYKDHAERTVECAEVLFNTGLVFETSRNKDRAVDAYNEAARIFREHGYKGNHPHLVKATRKIERLQSVKNGRK
jgi:tetratricopeptide (TPR) repeat protein